MSKHSRRVLALNLTIAAGSLGFVAVLVVAAYWDASIRWLHFFQALMYISALILCLRGNRWGYFIGISIAAFWDYANLFVTNFLQAGIRQMFVLLRTGHMTRLDLFIAVPAWTANMLLLLACIYGYIQIAGKSRWDLVRFTVAATLSTAYFALIMALFQPRYLGIFPRLIHPHLHL